MLCQEWEIKCTKDEKQKEEHICNWFDSCFPDLRYKLWLSPATNALGHFAPDMKNAQEEKTCNNFFLPQGKEYIFLSFKSFQKTFIKNHSFAKNCLMQKSFLWAWKMARNIQES